MGSASLRRRLRLCRRRAARAGPEGSHLALLAVRVHDPSSSRLADDSILASRLAGGAAAGANRAATARAGAWRALEQSSPAVHADADIGADNPAGAAGDGAVRRHP